MSHSSNHRKWCPMHRIIAVMIVILLLSAGSLSAITLPPHHWVVQEMLRLVQQSAVESGDRSLLESNRPVTRDQMAMILARLLESGQVRDGAALSRLVEEFKPELKTLKAHTDVIASDTSSLKKDQQIMIQRAENAKKPVTVGGELRLRWQSDSVQGSSSQNRTHLRSRFHVEIDGSRR